MIERLDNDDLPPRSSIRERLAALGAHERAERERARRRHHWPKAGIVWLALVAFAVLASTCAVRPW